jgi:ribosome-associated heat shock protein Hsp15
VIIVRALSDKRGPASVAQALYEETAESRTRRDAVVAELQSMPPPAFKGRPTKKTRRDYEKWLYAQDED